MNDWYTTLNAPPLTPPSWVFGPVWTVLYVMMGLGIFFWYKSPDRFLPRRTWFLLALHLTANAAWNPIFFQLQSPGLALLDIALIWVTLIRLLGRFRLEARKAYVLWLPYFLWVSFACYLNAGFWWLNR
jgi:tryptophan-rich sensory protein